jgi:hypothetical protein
MRKPESVKALENLGRERLSKSFFMRDFLYSEVANFDRILTFQRILIWRSRMVNASVKNCWNLSKRPLAASPSAPATVRLK